VRKYLCILAIFFSGCGAREAPLELVPVAGTVTWEGQPLEGAMVHFLPIEETPGVGGRTRTKQDGIFVITYGKGGNGLPPGTYRVVISKKVLLDGSEPPGDLNTSDNTLTKESLPPHLSDMEQSTLRKTISSPGGAVDFHLE
jgi:hypothetical protein